MIQKERIKFLNDKKLKTNKYVIYWMQASQRVEYNHALDYAISRANDLEKPLIVYFGLTDDFPEANLRHYKFMIEGLKEVKIELEKRKIKFIVLKTSPELGAIQISKMASIIIVDRGYLRIERIWREKVANSVEVPVVQIESNVLVPIEQVSLKEEYAASTIRNKINAQVPYFAKNFELNEINISSVNDNIELEGFKKNNLNDLSELKVDTSVKPSDKFIGGISEARNRLNSFIENKIDEYSRFSNNPELDYQSELSPYLHFGQISPLEIYLKVRDLNSEEFLEELVVRRELAINFVFYNTNYDKYSSIPRWAKESLEKHLLDKREYLYTINELENFQTHDNYWNACQKEMVITGKMHGYMRMYWGKKIIEWSQSPEDAFKTMIYLNNKYNIDGRDPNGFAGIAWCFGKHDRPWSQRDIFGYVRYMNAEGLKRKFDIEKYVKKWL